MLVDVEFCQRRRFWYEIHLAYKTNYRRHHFSSSLCFLSYKNPLDGTSKLDLLSPLFFENLSFQRKAAGSTVSGLKHEGILSVTPPTMVTSAQALSASPNLCALNPTFILPSHLYSLLQQDVEVLLRKEHIAWVLMCGIPAWWAIH